MIEELCLRRTNVDPKEQITKMKQLLISDEYPDQKNNPETKKCCPPFFFVSSEWSKCALDETWDKTCLLRNEREIRNSEIVVGDGDNVNNNG